MQPLLYAIILGIVMAVLRQLKGPQLNNIRELSKNIITSVVVAGIVFYALGYEPIVILGASYFADDVLMSILERYNHNEIEEWFLSQ